MVVADGHLLVDLHGAALDPSDRDPPYIVVVVDRRNQYPSRLVRVPFGRLDVVHDRIHQRLEVYPLGFGGVTCSTIPPGAEYHRAIELGVGCAEVHQQLERLVNHLIDPRIRPVDLVDDDDNRKVKLERLAQYKPGLGHRAFGRIDQQQHPVDHLEHPLDLSAEVGVSGGVNNVDLYAFVLGGGIFRKNGDPAFPLDVV